VSEFKEFNSQMVLTGVGILFNEIIVLKRHQDSVSRAAVQTGLGADFANAQLLMIEAETVQNLRHSVDPVNPVPLRGSFGLSLMRRDCLHWKGLFYSSHMLRRRFRNTTEGIDGVNHGFTIQKL
jgi:hypothetical protein